MQSDIATKVAHALGVALGAGEEKRLSEKPTQNLAAYDAFLKGEEVGVATDPPTLRKGLAFYEQAVALDPAFAQAWAGVSRTASSLYANSTPTVELANRARQAAEKAIALAPDRPEGYQALGGYRRLVMLDNAAALEAHGQGFAAVAESQRSPSGGRARRTGPRTVGRGPGALPAGGACRSPDSECGAGPGPSLSATLSRGPRVFRRRSGARACEPEPHRKQGDGVSRRRRSGRGSSHSRWRAPKSVDPTALVAFFGYYFDLAWVLDDDAAASCSCA